MSQYQYPSTPTPLTKEILHNYKYRKQVSRAAVQIRDTVCIDIEKGNIKPNIQTKYAYKIDEEMPPYKDVLVFRPQTVLHEPLLDVIKCLEELFPDSKIGVVDTEIMNGFTVTKSKYIEIDWS